MHSAVESSDNNTFGLDGQTKFEIDDETAGPTGEENNGARHRNGIIVPPPRERSSDLIQRVQPNKHKAYALLTRDRREDVQ